MEGNWTNKRVDKFVVVNHLLGEGAFGKVYRGFFTSDENKYVACKVIPIQAISDSAKVLDLIKREISILQKLTTNKYIVKLYDVARTNNNLYIFLEYCHDGDLKEYIKSKKQLSEHESVLFFRHICEGFKDLFKKKIIHRDIKPANLLLHEGIIKISDFGFSRNIEDNLAPGRYTRLGSPLYMAPQILEGENFNSKCDVWSVGVVFFEMLYSQTPWIARDQKELIKSIKYKPLQFPSNLHRSEPVKDLLKCMLRVKEEERYSWDQVFEHPVLQEPKPEKPLSSTNASIEQEDLELKEMNDKYLNKAMVAGYLDLNVEAVQEGGQSDETASQMIKNKQQQQSTIQTGQDELALDGSQLLKFKKDNEFRKSMQKMNAFILFERNIAFYFKYIIKVLFNYYLNQKLKIDSDLQSRILFCLCKCQLINLERVSKMVQEEKSTCFSDQNLWTKYKGTTEFSKTSTLINQDKDHSMKFYENLSQRTKQSLAKEIAKDESKKQKLEKFLTCVNNNFIMDAVFKENYQGTLKELIAVISPEIKNNKDVPQEILIVARYIMISLNPFNEFDGSEIDFNNFYEQVENMPQAQLREVVLKKLP